MIRADRSAGTAIRVVKLAHVLPASAGAIDFELEFLGNFCDETHPEWISDLEYQLGRSGLRRDSDRLNHSQPLRRFHFVAV